jgi:hypothetical protein
MKVFTILMLAVAAVYAYSDEEHLPPIPPPSPFDHNTCRFTDLGCTTYTESSVPSVVVGDPIGIPIGYERTITNEACCQYCKQYSTAAYFGLFIYEAPGVSENQYDGCRCYTVARTIVPQTHCIIGRGVTNSGTTPDTEELFSISL